MVVVWLVETVVVETARMCLQVSSLFLSNPLSYLTAFSPPFFFRVKRLRVLVCIFFLFWKSRDVLKRRRDFSLEEEFRLVRAVSVSLVFL